MCRIFAFLAVAVSATLFGPQSASAAVQIVSNFESGADGWTVVNLEQLQVPTVTLPAHIIGFNPPEEHDGTIGGGYPADGLFGVDHNITGGVSNSNYIFRVDPTGRLAFGQTSQWSWFSAPSKFLGDLTYATSLSFYLNTFEFSDAAAYSSVILVGAGQVIYQVSGQPYPPSGWKPYSFNFTAGTWDNGLWYDSANNNAATQTQIDDVLKNVTGLYINLDWYTDPNGNVTWPSLGGPGSKGAGLDSVVLTLDPPQPPPNDVVPEPSSVFSFAMAGFALLWFRSRRRRNE